MRKQRSKNDEWGQRSSSARRFHQVPDLQRREGQQGRQIRSGDLTIESVWTLGDPEPHGVRRSCFLERIYVVKHLDLSTYIEDNIFTAGNGKSATDCIYLDSNT